MSRISSILKEYRGVIAALTGCFLILFGVSARPVELLAILFCIGISWFWEDDVLVICCLACWMNLATVFKLGVGGTSFYTYVVILFAVRRLIRDRNIDKDFLLTLLIYAVYLIIGMKTQFMGVIKNVMMPLQLYIMAKYLDYQGLKRVSGYFILGNIIESTAAMNNSAIPNLSNYISSDNAYAVKTIEGYVPEPRFAGLWEDPNYYSIHLLLGIVICILLYSRREIKDYVFYCVVAVLTFFGAKTLSKSFILMLSIALAYAYILFIKHRQFGSVSLISVILIGVLILSAAGYINVFSMILQRLIEGMNSGGNLTTGRADIWKDYVYYFYSHPKNLLFGVGLGGQRPIRMEPHNSYLEIILYIGITGTLLFCMTLYNAVAATWPRPLRGSAMPLILLLIMYFFLGKYNSADLQMELLLILGYLWMNKETGIPEINIDKTGENIQNYEVYLNCEQ